MTTLQFNSNLRCKMTKHNDTQNSTLIPKCDLRCKMTKHNDKHNKNTMTDTTKQNEKHNA